MSQEQDAAARAAVLDASDPLAGKRAAFHLPDGVIYLDGNSLGPLAHAVEQRMAAVVRQEWGGSLIRGWTAHDWIDLPLRLGDRIARLIGAPPGAVAVADSTSVNLAKCLAAALALRPGRKVIVSERENFPTDLYMAEGLIAGLGQGHELCLVAREDLPGALNDRVAVLMLTEVDYKSGRLHDMAALTAKAHGAGVLTVWDLAHSAGALPVDLSGAGADFAVGCTYKYLNAGPGAPSFVFVRPDLQGQVQPLLPGWMGHAAPFAFEGSYRPAAGIARMLAGTPPILSLAALDSALDVWDDVDIVTVREKSIALGDLFITEVERRCGDFGLSLASPREGAQRGSQVSFHCPDGYAVMQALIARGVIGDFRAPDLIRFGFAPLYLGYRDVVDGAAALEAVLRDEAWRDPAFQNRAKVT